jgi:hypothetical protein
MSGSWSGYQRSGGDFLGFSTRDPLTVAYSVIFLTSGHEGNFNDGLKASDAKVRFRRAD